MNKCEYCFEYSRLRVVVVDKVLYEIYESCYAKLER